ncbi:Outer membrane protein assembly factor yaeT [Granulibacter bethesdensis]|nr:Outer membrane protein assembly factor yaeT [Granulibacter bethesdensis]
MICMVALSAATGSRGYALRVNRAALLATTCLLPMALDRVAMAQTGRNPSEAVPPHAGGKRQASAVKAASRSGLIETIQIEGNHRIETGTILSYMAVQPGDPFDPERIDHSLKTLYATGLFSDVKLDRQGNTLVVKLVENPIINRVAFEGNHKLTDEQLRKIVQLRQRAVFTPLQAQADRQAILAAYAGSGRFAASVEPKIVRLPDNRVDVIYEITEGDATLISRIAFVGNKAFSEGRLREVVDSRETRWWRFLSSSDTYNPERINYDKELLRRFYLQNGYVDFKVRDAHAELSQDRKSFFITYVLDEGERYKVGKITVESKLRHVKGDTLLGDITLRGGHWYDGDAVEQSVQAISDDVQNRGYAFVQVKPRILRHPETHIVDLVFDVTEGPRVYVERIDISGNTRTKDKVIRREFRLAEGDAYNAANVRRSRARLENLGYFNSVDISQSPGSTADRVVLNGRVSEKSTGELTLGGGFSTTAGALLNVGLRERNFVGSGIDAGISGVIAQAQSQANLNVTDPYFLDRNLVAGVDLYHTSLDNRYTGIALYSERRTGASARMGYAFNEHLRQSWDYSITTRSVYNVATNASIFIRDQVGSSLLSQIGQTFTIDYRDSVVNPHTGFVVRFGLDYAGIGGGVNYVRGKLDGSYYIPLDYFSGNHLWGIALTAGAGYLYSPGDNERIIDHFFMGGANLRGFMSGGAGPHDSVSRDSLGGRLLVTQSTELRFPLPISADLGLSGRAFVDIGSLTQAANKRTAAALASMGGTPGELNDDGIIRVGAGVGVSWQTPFGLINLDVAAPVSKGPYDQTQIFRFGFGTRF